MRTSLVVEARFGSVVGWRARLVAAMSEKSSPASLEDVQPILVSVECKGMKREVMCWIE